MHLLARCYERLKLDLAAAYPNDRVAYSSGKTAFIADVMAEARRLYSGATEG
jgi:GrpB-like predicted nucleotidyltransferase (UPF0157 family)